LNCNHPSILLSTHDNYNNKNWIPSIFLRTKVWTFQKNATLYAH
jgi:hypothetical protein